MNEDSASSAPLPAPTRSVAPTDGTTDGSRLALLMLLVGLALWLPAPSTAS